MEGLSDSDSKCLEVLAPKCGLEGSNNGKQRRSHRASSASKLLQLEVNFSYQLTLDKASVQLEYGVVLHFPSRLIFL